MKRLCTLRLSLISLGAALLLVLIPVSAFAMGHGGGGGGGHGGGGGGGGPGGGGDPGGGGYGGGGGNGGGGGGGMGGGGPGGGGGGGGGYGNHGGNGNDNSDKPQMLWYDSLDAALSSAGKESAPALAVIYRGDNASDKQALDLMSSWPQAIKLSSKEFAAVRVKAESDKGKAWIAQLNIKAFPFVVWLDSYGNAICGLQYPYSAVDLGNIVTGWKASLESVDKYLKEHITRGEALLAKGKLREAYLEFAWVTPFKGPESDAAKADQNKVQEAWLKLLDAARQAPTKSADRAAILKGLRLETEGLAFAPTLEKAILSLDAPKAENAVAVAQADAPPPADIPATPASSNQATPAAAMPVVESKTLKQLASAAPPAASPATSVDDQKFDTHLLSDSSDKRLKTAEESIQTGLDLYKRALADGMERGEERNKMLQNARGFFDIALNLIDESTGGKPNAAMEKLTARISMLIYGCLKYQTL